MEGYKYSCESSVCSAEFCMLKRSPPLVPCADRHSRSRSRFFVAAETVSLMAGEADMDLQQGKPKRPKFDEIKTAELRGAELKVSKWWFQIPSLCNQAVYVARNRTTVGLSVFKSEENECGGRLSVWCMWVVTAVYIAPKSPSGFKQNKRGPKLKPEVLEITNQM